MESSRSSKNNDDKVTAKVSASSKHNVQIQPPAASPSETNTRPKLLKTRIGGGGTARHHHAKVRVHLPPIESYERELEFTADGPGRVVVRLERLMGTDRVRLTDTKYMSTLLERLEAQEKREWTKRRFARIKAEEDRFRKLAIEGLTEPGPEMVDLYKHPVFRVNRILNRLEKMDRNITLTPLDKLPPIENIDPFLDDDTGAIFKTYPDHRALHRYYHHRHTGSDPNLFSDAGSSFTQIPDASSQDGLGSSRPSSHEEEEEEEYEGEDQGPSRRSTVAFKPHIRDSTTDMEETEEEETTQEVGRKSQFQSDGRKSQFQGQDERKSQFQSDGRKSQFQESDGRKSQFQGQEDGRKSQFQSQEDGRKSQFQSDGRKSQFQSDEAGRKSQFQGQDGRKSQFQSDEAGRKSQFQSQEDGRKSQFQSQEDGRKSQFQSDGRKSQFQSDEAGRKSQFQSDGRKSQFQSDEAGRKSQFQSDGRKSQFQGQEDGRKSEFQSQEDGRKSQFQSDGRKSQFQGQEDGRKSQFQGQEDGRKSQFQGQEDGRKSQFQSDGRKSQFQSDEAGRKSEFQSQQIRPSLFPEQERKKSRYTLVPRLSHRLSVSNVPDEGFQEMEKHYGVPFDADMKPFEPWKSELIDRVFHEEGAPVEKMYALAESVMDVYNREVYVADDFVTELGRIMREAV